MDCWIDNIKLIYDQYNQSFSNNDGVDIRVKNFGSTESMEYIDPSIKYSSSNYFFTFVDYFT